MAELDAEQNIPKKQSTHAGLILPLLIGAAISVVVGLFVLGYVNLTSPPAQPDDIDSLLDQKHQESDLAAADDITDNSTKMVVSDDGVFDFADYRYFSFPLPFVVNFADGNGMVTVEIAIATYETTMRGEQLIEKLTTFNPKMRSAINFIMAEQVYENLDTVAKRHALEEKLLTGVRLVIDGAKADEPSGITDLHFTKVVISGTR
ncbi:flagellar basal body-associated FliL family protein [Alphaproteobacteria bacterium]|nr:flagellar basal body-associated FliL family protein [Alphaproteobacteria bacterium]